MNSFWLLFKTQRWNLILGTAGCFLLLFLLVYLGMGASNLEFAPWTLLVSLCVVLFLACFTGFHAELFKMPFPMTYRQLAWIPTCCLATLWAAGFAGAMTGIGMLSILHGHAYAPPIFAAMLKTIPIAFLIFAVGDRLLRHSGAGAAYMYILLVITAARFWGTEHALVLYEYGWPLCIVLGVYFIFEAPTHIAAMEYPVMIKKGAASASVRMRGAPFRSPTIKVYADLLMTLPCLIWASWLVSKLDALPHLADMSIYAQVCSIALGVFAVFCILYAWVSTRANGLSPERTVVIFLMKCSIVLLPIAWALGAKRGSLTLCAHCRRFKFVWACHCPHCGHVNRGDIARAFALPSWKRNKGKPLGQKRVSPRRMYRVMLPMQLLILIYILHPGQYFHNESFMLGIPQEGSQTVFAEVRDYMASVDDARGWLDGDGDAPSPLPKRFRIEMREHSAGLVVKCHWLRWEHPGEGKISKRLKERITEAFPDIPFDLSYSVNSSSYNRDRVNRFALPTFFDEGIHWKAQ